jgi:acyl-CoA hydrolase
VDQLIDLARSASARGADSRRIANRSTIKMVVCGVEVWVRRQGPGERLKAAADFTVVAVDDDGWPRPLTGVT